MSKVLTDSQNYKDIADAIRVKNGSSAKYKPSEMATAIEAIYGGGGEGLDPEIYTETIEIKASDTNDYALGYANAYGLNFPTDTKYGDYLLIDAYTESGRPVSIKSDYPKIISKDGEFDFDDTLTLRYIKFSDFFPNITRDAAVRLFNNALEPSTINTSYASYIKGLNIVNAVLLDSENADKLSSSFSKDLCKCLNGLSYWEYLINDFRKTISTSITMPSGVSLRRFNTSTKGWRDDINWMLNDSKNRLVSATLSGAKSEYALESDSSILHFTGTGLCVGIKALDVPDTVTACVFDEGIDAYYADSCNSSTITKWIFKAPQGKKVTLADGNTKKWFASSKSSSSSKPVYDIYTDNQNIRDYAFSSNITVNFHALSEWTGV